MRTLALVSLSIILATTALAASSDKKPPKPKGPWDGTSISLGFSNTTGNSMVTSLNSELIVSYEKRRWKNVFDATVNYAENQGKVSQERYNADNQTQYMFSEKTQSYAFWNNSLIVDRFSAYDYQFVSSTGLGHNLVDKNYLTWSVQAGPGIRMNQPTTTHHITERVIFTTASNIVWNVTKNSKFTEGLTANWGSEYSFYNNQIAFTNSINKHLALSVQWNVDHYTDLPPNSSNTHKTDMITSVNVVYNF